MSGVTFELQTPRLRVRIMRSSDAPAFVAYRNDPEVARHQLWDLPYTESDADFLRTQDDLDDLEETGWTQLAVEVAGVVVGDVCCCLDDARAQAEVGFTLAREHWGHGYASEAALALVEHLVDVVGVVRVYGELDPVNVASQRVLESIGLVHESDTRKSFLWRGEWTDNMSYAATAEEWRAWRSRPTGPPDSVSLVAITPETQRAWARVETHWSQRRMVSPVATSYGDALFPEVVDGAALVPVLLGIEADGGRVGFLMYADATAAQPTPYLWRFLIDRRHQGRGIGRLAMAALAERLRDQGHAELLLSFGEGPGSPRGFYLGLGAELTGEVDGGEIVARLDLTRL